MEQDGMFFARKTSVNEAVLVFVKEKGGKYLAARVRVHKNLESLSKDAIAPHIRRCQKNLCKTNLILIRRHTTPLAM